MLVRTPDELAPALDRAFASGKPALVNVLTDPTIAYPRRANLALTGYASAVRLSLQASEAQRPTLRLHRAGAYRVPVGLTTTERNFDYFDLGQDLAVGRSISSTPCPAMTRVTASAATA